MNCDFSGKNILLTGANGYIGTQLVNRLLEWDCRITAIVRNDEDFKNCAFDNGEGSVVILKGDITLQHNWRQWLPQQDYVFHLAAQTSHYLANNDPVTDWKINAEPILLLLQTCQQLNCRPGIIFASTATVFGLPTQLPVGADAKTDPLSIYDIHKLTAEHYLSLYTRQFGIDTISLRLANVYGPSTAVSQKDRGVLNLMAAKALAGEELTIFGDGRQLRDYVYLADVVEAFIRAPLAFSQKEALGKAYTIATGVGTSFVDAVHLVASSATRITGQAVPIRHTELASKSIVDDRNFIGSWDTYYEVTGWQPKTSLAQGVEQLVETATAYASGSV